MNPDVTPETRRTYHLLRPQALALLTVALGVVLLLPIGLARAAASTVQWTAPTKADQTEFRILLGKPVALTLTAQASTASKTLSIEPVSGLPRGSIISTESTGGKARALFRWKPAAVGEYVLRFVARDGTGGSTPVRTYTIAVYRKAPKVHYPQHHALTNAKVGHWATVVRPAVVRAAPRTSARAVAKLAVLTPEETQNLVLILEGIQKSAKETWYRVRLPVLPNNSTGWVQKRFLGELTKVNTHLFIDRARLTATLKRNGVAVFTARIGIGEPQWPTPPGRFYIRSRLTNFGSPVYGPLAFGTSARSAVLTDWPGGGFVGIHGTNQPEILPGQVSHGCIRMRNPDIIRLAGLMKVGTPVTIR